MLIRRVALTVSVLIASCGGPCTGACGARSAHPQEADTARASRDLEPAVETSEVETAPESTTAAEADEPSAVLDPAVLGAQLARVRWGGPDTGSADHCRQEWLELQFSLEELDARRRESTDDEDRTDDEEQELDGYSSGWRDHRLDAQGRVADMDWNSDPVGLSGEFRYRYDARGDLVQVQEIPYESIEGGRPPRPAPMRVRTLRSDARVELVHTRGRELVFRERYGYDADGRVILRELLEGQRPDDGVRLVRCEYDERGRPSAREWAIDEGHWRREYVYEGDVLVAVRQDGRGATLWSQEGVFFEYGDDETAVFYAGSCYAQYFGPCAAAAAPRVRRGAPPPPEPAITFGRPLPPAEP